MAEVQIRYKGSIIPDSEMSTSGTKTCKTAGKYCEGDIIVEYTRPAVEDKTLDSYVIGSPVTPSPGYNSMSSFTLESNSLITNNTAMRITGSGTIPCITGTQNVTVLGTASTTGILYVAATNEHSNSTLYFGGSGSSYSDAIGCFKNTTGPAPYLAINSGKTLAVFVNSGIIGDGSNSSGNLGTILKLNNPGTIGDSTTAGSAGTAGYNGLYGTGTIYVSSTGTNIGSASSSSYRLETLILKAGYSSTYSGAYLKNLNVDNYAQIGSLLTTSYGRVRYLSNSGSLGCDSQSYNSGAIGSVDYPIANSGTVRLKHDSSSGSTYITPYGATCGAIPVTTGGKGNNKIILDVSGASNLYNYLNNSGNSGIIFRYTGTTTTYSGIVFTNGNLYKIA